MYQRNVIASFPSHNAANRAVQELTNAHLGEIQIRVLPPPSAARFSSIQQVIVSAIVPSNHAHDAEMILGRYGAVDLHDDEATYRTRSYRAQDDDWRSNQRSNYRGERRLDWSNRTWVEDLPWGTIAGATLALLSGVALLRGAQQWYDSDNQHDYSPGNMQGRHFRAGRFQSNLDYQPPSRSSSYPDGDNFRRSMGNTASQIADEADLAWGDHTNNDGEPVHPSAVRTFQPGQLAGSQSQSQTSRTGDFQTGAAVRQPSTHELGSGANAGSAITQGLDAAGRVNPDLGGGAKIASTPAGRDQSAGRYVSE